MCNLYSVTKGQQAIRELSRAMHDRTGNLPSLPGIFPDYNAPIVRNTVDGRELTIARWGMPSPVFALRGRNSNPGVTNVRNVASPYWRRWLGVESRCRQPETPLRWYLAIRMEPNCNHFDAYQLPCAESKPRPCVAQFLHQT